MRALAAQAGIIAPGNQTTPYAVLSIANDLGMTSATQLEIAADATSNASARLAALAAATVGGTVAVDFAGALPTSGTRYTIVSAATIVGQFDRLVLPAGVNGTLAYGTTTVDLVIGDSITDVIFSDGFEGANRSD